MTIALAGIGVAAMKNGISLNITVPSGGVPAGALIAVCSYSGIGFPQYITDAGGNTYHTAGTTCCNYAFNCNALNADETIVVTFKSQTTIAVSAFYATDILATSDPLDANASSGIQAQASGTSTTPLLTGPAPSNPGSLVIAVLGTNGAIGDNFTQAPGWSSLPTREGTSGGSAASNMTVDGGWQITSSTPTYNPTITKRYWFLQNSVFMPA